MDVNVVTVKEVAGKFRPLPYQFYNLWIEFNCRDVRDIKIKGLKYIRTGTGTKNQNILQLPQMIRQG